MTDETLSHRLILPADSNHHGSLYAGALLRIALEAAYATAFRFVGQQANLLLRRVHNLECQAAVPVGTVVEIRGRVLHVARAYLVVGLVGTRLDEATSPWMEALMGFVQVDEDGKATPFGESLAANEKDDADWERIRTRMKKLLRIR